MMLADIRSVQQRVLTTGKDLGGGGDEDEIGWL